MFVLFLMSSDVWAGRGPSHTEASFSSRSSVGCWLVAVALLSSDGRRWELAELTELYQTE